MDTLDDLDDLIAYSPEPIANDYISNKQRPAFTEKVVYVCIQCFRQYDLIEDLRGHMLEYHKYVEEKTNNKLQSKGRTEQKNCTYHIALDDADVNLTKNMELSPLPFKDFRLVLRAHMEMRCTAATGCAYKFQNRDKLNQHVKCHKDATHFSCYECGIEFNNWRRCSAHLWQAHKVDVDLLQCPVCPEFKSHASVLAWRHMRVHKKWRLHVLRSMRAVQRRRRQGKLHNSKEHKAQESAAEPEPASINNKKNKYYAEKICEICSRKFVNGKTLSKHVKTVHNKIKPFICNVCGKKTARKAALTIHMRQHTGEKPLQCKTCKFSTRDPSVLQKHQLRHDKSVKFKCALCDYACIQSSAYKRHLRLNHVEEFRRISCDLCSYSSTNSLKLLAHKEDHRKGLILNSEDSLDTARTGSFKYPQKLNDKTNEISADCFMPLESVDSLPHEPTVDTGGVTIPAPSEDTQFPTFLNS